MGYNPNQPRSANGQFAGGGGGSGGSRGGGKKGGKGKTAAGGTGAKRGRPAGASGRKVGTRTQQKKNAAAQAERTRYFGSKAAPTAAKLAYKAARGAMRGAKSGNHPDASLYSGLQTAQARVRRMENSRGVKGRAASSRSPRGGKVGTRAEQQRNARAQAARTAAFSSKAPVSKAKAAYKAARSAARFARRAARMGGGKG